MSFMDAFVSLWAGCEDPDRVYLAIPTQWLFGGEIVTCRAPRACLARCAFVYRQGSTWTESPRAYAAQQCGALASLDLQGRWLCWPHHFLLWHCHYCGGFLPEGEGGWCSELCFAADEDDDEKEDC